MSELQLLPGTTSLENMTRPVGWKAMQMKDFCSFSQGGRLGFTKQTDYRTSGVPAFSAAGQDGFVEVAEFVETDAVILSAIGANCGRCFRAHGRWTTLANVQAIIPDADKVDAQFLHYRVNRDDYWPRSGSAQPFIKPSDMKACWVAFPELTEQKTISKVLETLDTAIQETEAIIAKLKAVKRGLLHDLLTRGIDSNGELRQPQAEAPHLYKESLLGWIPKEWACARLDDVAVRGSGHTPSKNVPSYWNGDIKWVSLADSSRLDSVFIYDTDKKISALGIANSSAVMHSPGTVIMSRDAGIGKSAVLASEMAVSQHFMAWKCGGLLNNIFLYFHLQHEKPKIEAIAMGSTIKTIGLSFFKSYIIPLPTISEQEKCSSILMQAEQNLKDHVVDLEKITSLKAGVVDDLLTGRIRVTPLLAKAAQGSD